MPPRRTIRIALLLCDTPLPLVRQELSYPTYLPIFHSHLQDTLTSFPDQSKVDGVELEVDGFDVVGKGEYPDEGKMRSGWWDAVMMTGSAHSAYSPQPWLLTLITYIRSLLLPPPPSSPSSPPPSPYPPSLKIIGICFGMQVIAMALAKEGEPGVVPNENGWEIGVYEVGLSEAGRDWVGRIRSGGASRGEEEVGGDEGRVDGEMEGVVDEVMENETIHIQQMHRDHLPYLPSPDFHLLGSTPRCKIQGIVQYFPTTTSGDRLTKSGRKRIRVIGLQGHPEFTSAIVDRMIKVRSEGGVIDQATSEEARRRSGMKEGGEGRGVIGWGLWAVLLDL